MRCPHPHARALCSASHKPFFTPDRKYFLPHIICKVKASQNSLGAGNAGGVLPALHPPAVSLKTSPPFLISPTAPTAPSSGCLSALRPAPSVNIRPGLAAEHGPGSPEALLWDSFCSFPVQSLHHVPGGPGALGVAFSSLPLGLKNQIGEGCGDLRSPSLCPFQVVFC